jgi:hypothetical protein
VAQNRLVNSWGDYDHWLHRRAWFLRSYKEPGNSLSILRTDQHRGIIDFNEERDYRLEYILCDYKGNESHYAFTVHAQRPASNTGQPMATTSSVTVIPTPVFHWNQTNTYSLPGMQLVVPYGLLTRDVRLNPSVKEALDIDVPSDVYTFHDRSLPLVSDAMVSLYVQCPVEDTSKLYVSSDGMYQGGDYHDGWVTGHLRDLGASYTLSYDAEPPVVRPVSTTAPRLVLTVTDAQSGIASWRATVDGRFVVFDAIEKTTSYVCDLRETWLPPTGTTHQLIFTVTDNRQNTTTFDATFVY